MGRDDLRGITIGGKDLAEEMAKKSAKEAGETLKEERHYFRKGSKVRYVDHKEKSGKVTRASQASLNIINLESNLSKCINNPQKIICHMLAEEVYTSNEAVNRKYSLRKTDAARLLKVIYESGLKEYIERQGDRKKGYAFKFNEEGLNLTPEQAFELYKKNHKRKSSIKKVTTKEIVPENSLTEDAPTEPEVIEKDVRINVTIKFKVEWEV